MKVLHVSFSDVSGGAARATFRLHRALSQAGVDSRMWVRHRTSQDPAVETRAGVLGELSRPVRTRLDGAVKRLQPATDTTPRSINLTPTRLARAINGSKADVVNLHWIGADTMSIADVGRISKPVVMTLHDMWGFCGAEHLAPDSPDARWRRGYPRVHPPDNRGFDLDRWTWHRKKRHWEPRPVVCPSRWLADCASNSELMGGWPVSIVPNALDVTVFRPIERARARRLLDLPLDVPIVLFGADGGERNHWKGFDLLIAALATLDDPESYLGVIFGSDEPPNTPRGRVPLRWMGRIRDDESLAALYSAADVMVVPSRMEAFGQTASEAQASGTPVVTFNATGLPDVVADRQTGYLAAPFSTTDLAKGISWVLEVDTRRKALGKAARDRATRLWSPDVVASQYLNIYRQATELTTTNREL